MRVQDKVVIITGAANGIGAATARIFAREGAKIVAADINRQDGERLVQELREGGAEAIFVEVNVAEEASAQRLMERTLEAFGRIDVLINNAGIHRDGWLVKMSEEAWDLVIDVNLKGVFNCGKHAAKVMMDQGRGVIINTTSVVGLYGNMGQSNYAASKFGVIGLTKTWAKELAPRGIRVNAVAPGYTMTAMMDTVPEKILSAIKEKTPLKRLGEPEDVAYAYLYLASDEASYVNGAVLSVDGGFVIG
ncbi:beta-ketoacyl-ACP reductase [Candidatus Darwinibacter acetoxidans]|mgnify:CR=1 FL=1|jgi:3-oxoacyl-[acyl-carrier protein] reductase|nr:beta-ketoacyl-ACP reductase [Bacillota bacterium]HOB40809.1 beta-ketoacyl-ACP reductase [Limnochordia bacterium]HOQ72949.1 beta-ketoacyl-ACP reductase [Limnochordia bacterium]HPP73334.1 beta-ketoacyl-ACP reductase [Limnochordia bacterium]HPU65940.1 beta-ketoacyl-ACP reductase [Limnochordia bacterium]